MVSTVNPKAKATPMKPMPRAGKAAASTALPQPPNTSQKVPMNSANDRLIRDVCIPNLSDFQHENLSVRNCLRHELVWPGAGLQLAAHSHPPLRMRRRDEPSTRIREKPGEST